MSRVEMDTKDIEETEEQACLLKLAVEEGSASRKAFPMKLGAFLALGLLVTVGIAAGVAHNAALQADGALQSDLQSDGKSNVLQDIDMTGTCEVVFAGAQKVINDKLAKLPDPANPNTKISFDGPEMKIMHCEAKTKVSIAVEEITGLSSMKVALGCEDATVSVTMKASVDADVAITFSEPLVVTLKADEQASLCHVPKNEAQQFTFTIDALSTSADLSATGAQGVRTKLTSASMSNLKIHASRFAVDCKGKGCDEAKQGGPWMKELKTEVTGKVSEAIENTINKMLASEMPMTV